ncbi:hypothetical protein ANCDUO_00867 [Ancylostoma duodenale]|uniref:Uncharacterized protein n=1 Tax=Ancylostoma duodenale TaxID=51022 RepID=A0A0C2H4R6_9BILA|nr:hypothetical protein ANCDUO_00867 [Ancylostoma duodenale]
MVVMVELIHRWCVDAKLCVGPLGCPLGKPVVQRDPFRCPVKYTAAKGKRYTDALGRSLYAIILSMKDSNVSHCLSNLRPDVGLVDALRLFSCAHPHPPPTIRMPAFSFVRTYNIDCDDSGNMCSGMIAVSEEGKAIYMVFRDTASRKQSEATVVTCRRFSIQCGAMTKAVLDIIYEKGQCPSGILDLDHYRYDDRLVV